MKTPSRTNLYLPIAAMILTAALADPASAQTSCLDSGPGCFKGIFQGQDAHPVQPPGATTVAISTTALGNGAHLGRFSLIREITGSLVDFSATGSAQWIAANRDSIYTTIVGHAELSDLPGGFLRVTETHTITGGTGRFAEARGSFTVELFHKLEPSEVSGGVETHEIFGSFHGTVTRASRGAAE
ncbi:MAG TPA: hypothetical protein VFT29_03725 [Gemmatimonadaceae bacterium]|nr:hypothetical protein [Gemmatimonadaceae bacterium]